MKKSFGLAALGFVLAVIFAAALPARAADVDQRIKALEDELTRLKVEQTQVKAEQIELKKNALAAEGALPTFSYRAGNGLLIEAADKSWSLNTSFESHMRMLFESGNSHAGRTNGEVMGRRFRPRWMYGVNNSFYETELSLDLDGWGTLSPLQRGAIWVHLEQISPWLPTAYFGMDIPAAMSDSRQGSSSTTAQSDYDLLSRNNGFNTGSTGQGIGFNWDDKPLDAIGIPGRIKRFNLVMGAIGEGGDGNSTNMDAGRNFDAYLGVNPFSQIKNKWLQGLLLEVGAWFCRVDPGPAADAASATLASDNACRRLRIRDHGDGGRQVLFDTGSNIGRGWTHFIMPGVTWDVGPYRLRVAGGFQRYDGNNKSSNEAINLGQTQGNMFLIGHDLFLWSPKGWFTGSSGTPGSVLFGTHFERTDVTCNAGHRSGLGCGDGGEGNFNRNTILIREWDLWYFLMSRTSIGISWLWYDATNLPLAPQKNLGVRSTPVAGKGGDWLDIILNFRYTF